MQDTGCLLLCCKDTVCYNKFTAPLCKPFLHRGTSPCSASYPVLLPCMRAYFECTRVKSDPRTGQHGQLLPGAVLSSPHYLRTFTFPPAAFPCPVWEIHQSALGAQVRALVLNFGRRAPLRGSPKLSHFMQVPATSSREGTALLVKERTQAGLGGCDLEKCQLNYYRLKGAT